jgi:hypothetical protein
MYARITGPRRHRELRREGSFVGAIALTITVIIGLSGCSTPTLPPAGALTFGGDTTNICFDSARYVDAAYEVHFDITGKTPITIDSVKPTGVKGLRLVDAWVVPYDPKKLGFGTENWPIQGHDAAWAKRVPAKGAVLQAASSEQIVLHVSRSTAVKGSIGDVHVNYTQAGVHHSADPHTSLEISSQCTS